MELITEFEFELPRGYLDENGELHKRGVMRMATAADEILPLRDPRVVSNPAYLTIILLSRVVTSLGTLTNIRPTTIEKLSILVTIAFSWIVFHEKLTRKSATGVVLITAGTVLMTMI